MKTHLEKLSLCWQDSLTKIKQLQGDQACHFHIAPPATVAEIEQAEAELGYQLPPVFKQCLQSFSKEVDVGWFIQEPIDLFNEYDEISSGEIAWGLQSLEDLTELSEIVEEKELVGMLAFSSVPNGDLIAFDMKTPEHPIYYWGHEGEGLIYLAPDLISFLNIKTELHLAGPELWQIKYFIDPNGNGLNLKLPKAQNWIQLFASISG